MRREQRYLPPYKNLLLVAGLLLVLLGIGNWVVGAVRAGPYADYLRAYPGPAGTEGIKSELLAPPDDKREERNVSRAKLQFYELVRSGGRLMVVMGAVSLLAGLMTQRGTANTAKRMARGQT